MIGSLFLSGNASADSNVWSTLHNSKELPTTLKLEKFSKTFERPWSIEPLSATIVLLSEKGGAVKLVDTVTGQSRQVASVSDSKVHGQGGLLDLEPEWDGQGKLLSIFVTGTAHVKDRGYTTALWRADLNPPIPPSQVQFKNFPDLKFAQIFVANAFAQGGRHFGSRLTFDSSGFLYMTVGDRGKRHEAQNLKNHKGTVIRLTRDGVAAPGNPFAGTLSRGLPEIWSYGHRNAQGLFFHKSTRQLWLSEHGPQGGDEINLIEAGKDYGWPQATHGEEYGGGSIGKSRLPGMIDPIYAFVPSIAPSGLLKLGSELGQSWEGHFLSGSLVQMHVNRLFPKKMEKSSPAGWSQDRLLEERKERFRDLRFSPDQRLYLISDSGTLYRISRK